MAKKASGRGQSARKDGQRSRAAATEGVRDADLEKVGGAWGALQTPSLQYWNPASAATKPVSYQPSPYQPATYQPPSAYRPSTYQPALSNNTGASNTYRPKTTSNGWKVSGGYKGGVV